MEKKSGLKGLQIGERTAAVPIIQGGMGVGVSRSRLAGRVQSAMASTILLPRRRAPAHYGIAARGPAVSALPAAMPSSRSGASPYEQR